MFPNYVDIMIAREKHKEQIKKAEYQRLIRFVEDEATLARLSQIYQRGPAMKQLALLSFIVVVLVMSLAGCGGPSQAAAEEAKANPEKETSGEVVAALSQASTMKGAAPNAPAPTATPAPEEPVVTQLSGYLDAGTFHIMGTILNNTDTVITDVELAVSAKDASGKSLLTDFFGEAVDQATFIPEVSTLQPGQSVPFGYRISAQAEPASYDVVINAYVESETQAAAVEVQHGQMVKGEWGSLYLVGELVNLGETPVEISGLLGAIYNANDQVVDLGEPLNSGFYLAPAGDANGNDRAPFRVMISSRAAEEAETWAVYPMATVVEPYPAYKLALSEPVVYEDEFGGVHLVGTVTNNDQIPLTVYLVGGLYAADGTVVDADFNDVPFYAVAPGQTLPYELSDFDAASSGVEGNVKIDHATVVVDWRATAESTTAVVPVETQNDTHEANSGWWQIKGEVLNSSDQTLSMATVIVALYDAEGKVVGTQYAYPTADAIAPQGVAPYELSIYTAPELDPASLTLKTFVEGRVQ